MWQQLALTRDLDIQMSKKGPRISGFAKPERKTARDNNRTKHTIERRTN